MDRLSIVQTSRRAPHALALIGDDGAALTYAELEQHAARFAARAGLTFVPGNVDPDPVALVARPCIAAIVAVHALFTTGTPVVLLHPRWTDREREEARAITGAKRFLCDEEVDSFAAPSSASEPSHRPLDVRDLPPTRAAAILLTSGSTSRPKAVVLERRAFVASFEAHASNIPPHADDRWLLALPFSHVGGLSILARALLAEAAVVVLPRFEARASLEAIKRHHVTLFSVVPTMLRALLDDALASDLRGVTLLVGGAAASPELLAKARAHGATALATYGMTETCSQIATQSPTSTPGTVGNALHGVELRLIARDGSAIVTASDTVGRLFVRGPMLMRGYLGAPRRSAHDWLETRDLATIDTHTRELSIIGRVDETIITGGENVDPLEVERALASVPGVREALVFGVDDDRWGTLVAAAIVADGALGLSQIIESAGRSIASFKRPKLACQIDALPVLSNGKVDRRGAPKLLSARLSPVASPGKR